MKAYVLCEESQVVCIELRKMGVEAYSCDIKKASGGHPEWHIKGDCRELDFSSVDLVIAHPPCTYLSSVTANLLFDKNGNVKDVKREELGWMARDFFMWCYDLPVKYLCIENPTPLSYFGLPYFMQTVQPFQFGDPFKKRTCLWLKGLPLLKKTGYVEPIANWVERTSSSTIRSRTFPGIARAMAEQWVPFCYRDLDDRDNLHELNGRHLLGNLDNGRNSWG